MSSVVAYNYTVSATYVADKMLKSLKDIIVMSGLDPAYYVENREYIASGIKAWLESEHLESVELEIYDPQTDKLVTRWDMPIVYGWSADDGGCFWTDTELLKYHIKKQGLVPSQAKYRVVAKTKPGRPQVDGWSSTTSRSTEGMVRQSLGTTVEHNGLGAQAAYWRSR